LSAFGYIFNTALETVPVEADVTFNSNGITTAGITHAPGTSQIVVSSAGNYQVTFSVSSVEPNQFALFVNGLAVAGSVYGSGAGTQQNTGQVILTLAAGDVLTLRNHTSLLPITLLSVIAGLQTNVNASILIEKLN
jgi:hypothetical protein